MIRHTCSGCEKSPGEAGFSLAEAVTAVAILIVGLMAVSNLIVVSISTNRVGSTSTAASAMATETMERIKAIPFNNLTAGGSLTADNGIAGCEEVLPTDSNCVVAGNFNYLKQVPGVAPIKTRWVISQVDNQTLFIRVRSEAVGLAGIRSRAEFTTIRSCTAVTSGCPAQ